jgi:hypothetical protein
MLKRIALLVAMAALTIVKPSNAVAQGWDGWGGNCCERRFIPRPVFCCERPFIPRPIVCCERPFIPRPIICCERPFIPRPVFCCDDRRFFPRPYGRPPYYYGDRFAPYAYNWNAGYGYDWNGGYTGAGYGYDWNGGYTNAAYGYNEY